MPGQGSEVARAAWPFEALAADQDEREVRAQLALRVRQQAAVAELGQDALRGMPLQMLFQKATEKVATILRNEYCKVLEVVGDGSEVFLRAGVGWKPGLVGVARVSTGRDSQAGYTLLSDAPVIVEDLRTETRFSGPQLLRDHGVISGMSVIIRGPDGRPWGVLGTHTRRRFHFTQDDVNFLQSVSNTLGTAIIRTAAQERLERAVEEGTSELRQANRELEAFSYSVSHDLRSRLRSMIGFTQLASSSAADRLNQEEKQTLGLAVRAGHEMGRIIDDLLRLSGVTRAPLQRVTVQITELAEEVVDHLRQDEPARQVEIQIQAGLVAQADEGMVRVLLENLLGNAWKFTRNATHPRIEVSQESTSEGHAFVVRDSGAGFDVSTAKRLFEPFQRYHRSDQFEGSGIGLAIVQRVVGRHGGRVWIESKPGVGTSVFFTLGS